MRTGFHPSTYRYPHEQVILWGTLLAVGVVIALTAAATVCSSLLFVGLVFFMAYQGSKTHHQALLHDAYPITSTSAPGLDRIVQECAQRLNPGQLDAFVAPSRALNAYTFGLEEPKAVVLYSALLQVMDETELRFIVGHEMGHLALGHTWLNSLVGGLSGIPSNSSASLVLRLAFLWWNRTCELSADRAGLLACGSLEKSITALIKLVAGPAGLTPAGLAAAYRLIDAEDDTPWGALGESLQSHPMLIRRINELRKYNAHLQAPYPA